MIQTSNKWSHSQGKLQFWYLWIYRKATYCFKLSHMAGFVPTEWREQIQAIECHNILILVKKIKLTRKVDEYLRLLSFTKVPNCSLCRMFTKSAFMMPTVAYICQYFECYTCYNVKIIFATRHKEVTFVRTYRCRIYPKRT